MSEDDDDKRLAFYNAELLKLSALAETPVRLSAPHLKARAISPICGSEVEVDLMVDGDVVTAFGFEVDACALTKTAVAVMSRAIIGKTRQQVAEAGVAMEAMLNGENIFPAGDWAGLKILEPVKDYKARHNSILLPFEAVEKAFKGRK